MKKLSFIPAIILALLLTNVSDIFAQYTPGTYKASAMGRSDKKHKGTIEVEVTVSESKIEKINVLTYDQSVDHKKYGKEVTEAKNNIPAQLLEQQSLGVDAVAKATMASNAIELAVAKALHQASTKKYTPGTYKGSAMGRSDKKHKGTIEVEVTVSESKIEDVKVLTYDQSVDHKKYGKQVSEAKESIPTQIKAKQSLDVDVVTKATFAANAIDLAVARALDKAKMK